ncbi:glycoprotein-N-acetylgalactosamine 3-beta-galactosyltransferase 1-like [Teleopsis dalmanni]|uniref:glycoprotein-N-acetylgalactosamine 3-beta-galactosyltransferase 1-like n=1 Tax=Teleopsis dalmanni TaxID=139649 RepID=UPI0018CEE13B|nr:glycoprotein-N-acetylgalactosamine 3-beta-galactosyltransferase 1-like [Teleopsis dalmanni]
MEALKRLGRNRVTRLNEFGLTKATNRRNYAHLHTLIGFVLGFLMAFATLLFYDRQLLSCEQIEHHSISTEHFYDYFVSSGFAVSSSSSGGSSGSENLIRDNEFLITSTQSTQGSASTAASGSENVMDFTEIDLHQHLESEVRVLCMVLTCPKYHSSRAAHVKATWGQRCTKLIFVSSVPDEELGVVNVIDEEADTYHDLWNKTREGFRYVHEHFLDDYDWFLKADDDTYVIMENLRYMLYAYSPDMPIYFGYKLIRYKLVSI